MTGPVITYRTKYARNDWWMFALFAVSSMALAGILGYAMRRDEIEATSARAEHMARTMAEQFASEAATPGSDFAGTLPFLVEAMGKDARLAVVRIGTGEGAGEYVGHSAADRVGRRLDPNDPNDRLALELIARARRDPGHFAILWREGLVEAAAVASGGYAAVVDGLRPPPTSDRPARFAAGALLFLLVVGAGFQDVLYKFGQILNLGVLAGVAWVGSRLGAALEPSLWRAVTADPLVLRAQSLKLADVARVMAQDLPPRPSALTEWGARAAWVVVAFYLVALFGVWHRAGRIVERDARAYRYVAPAFGVFAVCAGLPLLMGIGLAFWRVTPTSRTYLGFANFAAFMEESPSSPTSLWRTLFGSTAWVIASGMLQLFGGVTLTLIVAQVRGWWRGFYRLLLMLPWVLPGYAAALLWAQLWHASGEPLSQWLGLSTAWLGQPMTAAGVNLMASIWMGTPIIMAVGLTMLDGLTPDQWDAARLEGVTGLRASRLLVWPLLRPLLIPGFAFTLFWSFGSFAVVDLISGGGPDGASDLLTTRAYHWAFERNEYGYAAAWSMIAFVVAAVVIVGLLKWARRNVAEREETAAMPSLAFESS